jgi:hypothetical protein
LLGLLSSDLGFVGKLEALIAFASEGLRSEHGCLSVKGVKGEKGSVLDIDT